MLRVAGIDPGTIRTGIGILEQDARGQMVLVCAETIHVNEKKSIAARLREIHESLREFLTLHKPDVVALENVFYQKDFKAAVKIGEARAVAMLAAESLSISIEEYPPARVKEAICGNGRAHKSQVQFMVKQLLRLKELPPPDSADALAIAVCHLQASRWCLKKNAAVLRA